MPAISPGKFFKWTSARLLLDIRPSEAFKKGSLDWARSTPINSGRDFSTLREHFPSDLDIHLIDHNGEMASQLSNAFACNFLQGGYKLFRAWRDQVFAVGPPIWIIGGFSGSGKTEFLEYLSINGYQVVNLEELAGHKGSVFGKPSGTAQPLHEHFQNRILKIWLELNCHRPLLVEEKGPFLGKVGLPQVLYNRMRCAPMIHLNVSYKERCERVQYAYDEFEPLQFKMAIKQIESRMGTSNNHRALHYYDSHQKRKCFELLLNYYDHAYIQRRKAQWKGEIINVGHNPMNLAATMNLIDGLLKRKPAVNTAGNLIPKN